MRLGAGEEGPVTDEGRDVRGGRRREGKEEDIAAAIIPTHIGLLPI